LHHISPLSVAGVKTSSESDSFRERLVKLWPEIPDEDHPPKIVRRRSLAEDHSRRCSAYTGGPL
jgi:hypothetical protein